MQTGDAMRVLGAMSGTSLDGVDAAVITTDGHRILDMGPTAYRPYTDTERDVLRAALGRWPGPEVAQAARVVEDAHLEVFQGFEDVDLIGFHGQTLAHDPDRGRTHQVGNGPRIAEQLGVPVAWDFRSADVAAGGQGAPLASFYHFACAKWMGATQPLCFLNLGGVGNLTWVDPRFDRPEDAGALLAFDTGPANAPINDLITARLGQSYDAGGALAAGGQADHAVVKAFLQHDYFLKSPPKSLDRDDFPGLLDQVSSLSDADAAATLAACAVAAVARGMDHCPEPPAQVLVTGGGRHNAVLMDGLARALKCSVLSVDDAQTTEGLAGPRVAQSRRPGGRVGAARWCPPGEDKDHNTGLNGDMLEAQAFAFLAARIWHGLPITAPGTTGVKTAMTGGQISGQKAA
ncbi:anhydro-N-acetylmuramic acid kinase [Pseudaestuariivita rosea]|uniref:anhydro-N-acetylmuramic acid kinase n=1 Tax=Pseudaestuariivita rosea TaxID=2763263 RepID=UPI001F01FC67|nr:anhydro-N-acetylmuramic acid kinase [Pseudaestuariivita rosea]